jgi:hypothetical protein
MRLVATNAHKNPIVLDCPWMFTETEEAHLDLNPGRRRGQGEDVYIAVPSGTDGDPQALIHVSHTRVDDKTTRFVVETCREDEAPTPIAEWTIEEEEA